MGNIECDIMDLHLVTFNENTYNVLQTFINGEFIIVFKIFKMLTIEILFPSETYSFDQINSFGILSDFKPYDKYGKRRSGILDLNLIIFNGNTYNDLDAFLNAKFTPSCSQNI